MGDFHGGRTLTRYLEEHGDVFRVIKKGPGMHEVELVNGVVTEVDTKTNEGIKEETNDEKTLKQLEKVAERKSVPSTSQKPIEPPSQKSAPQIPSKSSRSATQTEMSSSSKATPVSPAKFQKESITKKESLPGVQATAADSLDTMDNIAEYIHNEQIQKAKPLFDDDEESSIDAEKKELDDILRDLNADEDFIDQQLAKTTNEEMQEVEETTSNSPSQQPSGQQDQVLTPNTDASQKLEEAQRILEEARQLKESIAQQNEGQHNADEDESEPDEQEESTTITLEAIKKTWIYGWLQDLNMEKYASNFVDYGVTDEDTLAGIEKSDLNKMQVKNLDDRNTIFQQLELKKKQNTVSNMDFDF
eukprot:CAMPEP_0117442788 /NCGR_PEP_ID=MMETSP0759-20121206/4341_1 /TAXON_ID=63605 /ORGANISM="Percolomonas cosmopolitus, Strain WS" /LENGTH=359 /DNA_ID=CAMNT_0005234705 /DNA_START=116 /DNA_END=1195 /DNA_ORIENTATION=+